MAVVDRTLSLHRLVLRPLRYPGRVGETKAEGRDNHVYQHRDGSWKNPAVIRVSSDLSVPKLIFDRAERNPNQVIIERRVGGAWHEVRAAEFVNYIEDLSRGFYALGVRPGDRVAILAPTSYEWAALDIAVLSVGGVTVPIYETDSASQIGHILKDAGVSLVIAQSSLQAEMVQTVKTRRVREIIALDSGGELYITAAGREVPPATVDQLRDQLTLTDIATIIYTSGTTGMPKGVVLTQSNFVESVLQSYDILPDVIGDPRGRTLLFLPVAHVLARFVMYGILIGEGRLGFSPDIRNLVGDIKTFKPTMMLAVPRVLEKVYNTAAQKSGGGVKRKIFAWSAQKAREMSEATAFPRQSESSPAPTFPSSTEQESLPRTSDRPSARLRANHKVANVLVLRKVRAILGPNLRTIICGGAPLSVDLANFYRGLGIDLLQGYGLSETTGPITVQRPGDNPPDSVGYLWPGNSMKIAEDGELLLRGVSVSPGYHNLPGATAESFKDGWFHTGDLGSIDSDGRLSITGRKKELIVTAGGKNVSPEILQDSLSTHPLISQVVVVGDAEPYIAALVTLDPEMLPVWLRNKGLDVVSVQRAIEMPEVKHSIERAIRRANRAVSRAESIRRYVILPVEFKVENAYLTSSLKLKRQKVLHDFKDQIKELYNMNEQELSAVGGSINSDPGKGAPPAGG